jgi:muramoyltetrapeptide carboxypeptidase
MSGREALKSMVQEYGPPAVRKPKALRSGSRLRVVAPASPGEPSIAEQGFAELDRLGFDVDRGAHLAPEGYFAGPQSERLSELVAALGEPACDGVISLRGGYGSNYLLGEGLETRLREPKCVIGFSDLTSLQIFLWQKRRWPSVYGPMVGAGLPAGAGQAKGYDRESFLDAIGNTVGGWELSLWGEPLHSGESTGILLGGCLTLVETTLGTPWELDTRDAILLLEDRGMKPWQVDRALMHLAQAGKLDGVRGMVLGDFPDCDPPIPGSPSVRDVCTRILRPLGVPIVFHARVGHTERPMLTLPLGVQARLQAKGEGTLEILEPAVLP